ncbi:MAG: phosphoenolpyruvate carboxylase [archaeon]
MGKNPIPRCMSTQHPDNVTTPFFAESPILGGEDEIKETYYAFSHLGCTEQMWDYEGKEVDSFVIKKLLSKYPDFFRGKEIGRSVFITPRVPNPEFERDEAKSLLETLESIPRSFDTARLFYGKGCVPPIFEVILPMTTSAKAVNKIHSYYRDFVGGKGKFLVSGERVADWIGEFNPKEISVIPLLEDRERMSKTGRIVKEYLRDKNPPYQRVFLARSDPAMNYGLVGAVLLAKIALAKLDGVSKDTGIEIHPIIGVGSVVFRGGFSPARVKETVEEYPSVSTYTIQSAFKYDWAPGEVSEAIEDVSAAGRKRAQQVSEGDEREIDKLIDKYSRNYQRQILKLAKIINKVSEHVPSKRKRKLHVGIWGYSRSLGKKKLPRAIGFTSALYSIGLPPELIGLDCLDRADVSLIERFHSNFLSDIGEAARFANFGSGAVPEKLGKKVRDLIDVEADAEADAEPEHARISGEIFKRLKRKDHSEGISELVVRAGSIRKFLG